MTVCIVKCCQRHIHKVIQKSGKNLKHNTLLTNKNRKIQIFLIVYFYFLCKYLDEIITYKKAFHCMLNVFLNKKS